MANFGSVQRIAELVQLFEDKYKHLAIRSVWLIEKFKENNGFQVWHGDFWLGHEVTLTIVVNSLVSAMDGRDHPLLSYLRSTVVSCQIFIRSQSLIAR